MSTEKGKTLRVEKSYRKAVLVKVNQEREKQMQTSYEVNTGLLYFYLIFGIAFYVYMAYCLMVIANKTGTENAWMAWVPIVNIILMLQIAEKPTWWIILAIIPCLNLIFIVLNIFIWMAIAEKRGKPSWWGVLMIVPFVNLIVPGYLAFSD